MVVLFSIKRFVFRDAVFKPSKKVIVIDPGHGGEDPGSIGFSGKYEKDINLEISTMLKEKLNLNGYKAILTRDSDKYIDSILRTEMANKENARIFISIHCNSLNNDNSVTGIQILYYPNRNSSFGDLNNYELAEILMNSLVNGTGAKNRGIIEGDDYKVLNRTKIPAVIIECGFISNENEEKLLLTDDYKNKIIDSIVYGLEEYFRLSLLNSTN